MEIWEILSVPGENLATEFFTENTQDDMKGV